MEDTEHLGQGLGVMAMVQPRHSVHEDDRPWKNTETAWYTVHHLMTNKEDLLDGWFLPMSLDAVA